jgi:hypothetical protein
VDAHADDDAPARRCGLPDVGERAVVLADPTTQTLVVDRDAT